MQLMRHNDDGTAAPGSVPPARPAAVVLVTMTISVVAMSVPA